jgi:hypothetical protein
MRSFMARISGDDGSLGGMPYCAGAAYGDGAP